MALDPGVQMPMELRPFKALVDAYVMAKVKQFSAAFSRRVNMSVSPQQLDMLVNETLAGLAQEHIVHNTRVLRLVLRHDCQSTGCGEAGCLLCQYNPSRLCKRNLKNKYLIDDHLRAKCGAPLRVELVDESGACVSEGLPPGTQLEVHVLNGEKYKEICPDNTLLSHLQLQTCVISHHTKALLKREGGSDDQLRCFLQLERGQGPLSDLQVTTSSEALLAGKAPTFRLLVWAVDALGDPVSNVTYVVSENFVVATKRVKHAIKSDIPSVADSVSKLVHIGKATVDKLVDLRGAAREEGFEIAIPDELNRIEKVGQFQALVEQSEMNSDLKNKIRHLLKLSPEKWDEVAQHAMAAVVPDFRNRVWWQATMRLGLLFSCKNGAVAMDHPTALVKMAGSPGEEDQVIPIHQLDPALFHSIPKLKQQAIQNWYAAQHPGWQIYWKEGQADGGADAAFAAAQAGMVPMSLGNQMPMGGAPAVQLPMAPALNAVAMDLAGAAGLHAGMKRPLAPSPFAAIAQPLGGAQPVGLPGGQPPAPLQAQQDRGAAPKSSPFAVTNVMENLTEAFPNFQPGPSGPTHGGDNSLGSGALIPNVGGPSTVGLPSLSDLKSDMLPGINVGLGREQSLFTGSLFGLNSNLGFTFGNSLAGGPSLELLAGSGMHGAAAANAAGKGGADGAGAPGGSSGGHHGAEGGAGPSTANGTGGNGNGMSAADRAMSLSGSMGLVGAASLDKAMDAVCGQQAQQGGASEQGSGLEEAELVGKRQRVE